MTIQLTDEQQAAVDAIEQWAQTTDMEFTLGGLAGTGKTTCINFIREAGANGMGLSMQFLTPTGKAASVLRKKGVPADTVHSFAFKFIREKENADGLAEPEFEEKHIVEKVDLVVVDEASMISEELAQGIRKHNLRVLWVGDHGQLQPVGVDPGIMTHPDVRLETIHRQAADNPILQIAHAVRRGENPRFFKPSDDRVKIFPASKVKVDRIVEGSIKNGVSQILCAFNRTRYAVNTAYRAALSHRGLLVPNDKLICLLNDRSLGIYNGETFTVDQIKGEYEDAIWATVRRDDGRTVDVTIWKACLGKGKVPGVPKNVNVFDYGYCITAHKSQGSEWPAVLVIDEPCAMDGWDNNRWRYTAMTRAKERLIVIA